MWKAGCFRRVYMNLLLPVRATPKALPMRRTALPRTLARGLVSACAATALVVTSLAVAPAATAATTGTDTFERSVASGWGPSIDGRSWTTTAPSSTSVAGGSARVSSDPGTQTTQTLSGGMPQDATLSALLWPESRTATGNGPTISLVARSEGKTSYQARVRFGTSGVNLWLSRMDARGAESVLASSKPIASIAAGQKVRAELSVSGQSPVVLKARVWIDGAAQPTSWQQTISDSSDARVRAAGSAAVSTHLSSGSPAMAVRVDDVTVLAATAASTPTPEPTATATPTPTPTPTAQPGSTTAGATAGSAAVGSTRYTVPAGAIYAAAKGTHTGAGTANNPYGSAAYAVEKAPNGSTIVLRGGTYRESVYIGFNRKLTIQSYPGEAVWFDGSSPVSGWTKSGSTWVANWSHPFDRRVSFNANLDETARFTDSRNPLAGYPEQVWIDGEPLRQVGSATQVTSGTFFADTSAKRLMIGSDPSGRRVDASTLTRAIQVQGAGTTLRGFGVQRYATTLNMMGTVTAEVHDITLENLVVRDNATIGVYAWNDNQTLNKLTVTGNGMLGIGANGTHNLRITNSVVSGNNTQAFKPAPVSGGMKLSGIDKGLISGNVVADNDSAGVWFDVSSYDLTVTGNRVTGNSTTGVQVEISEKAVIADNYISGNDIGLQISNSGSVQVWNNAIDGVKRALSFTHDRRRQEVSSLASKIPWVMKNITLRNNAISYSAGGSCPMLTQDYSQKMYGNDFGISLDGNVYHRATASAPSNFACWANGTAGTRSFKTLEDFSRFTGNDQRSALWMGNPIFASDLKVVSAVLTAPKATTYGLPSDVATAIGQKAGATRVGPFTAPAK